MRKSRAFGIAALLALPLTCCTQAPPAEYLTPEFEEVLIYDADPDAVRFTCRMSSLSQLVEYGLDYTDDWECAEPHWTRVAGTRESGSSFVVVVGDFEPNTTYCYKMFISNGKDSMQSAPNYYTTPE
jgi:hypothetical protein